MKTGLIIAAITVLVIGPPLLLALALCRAAAEGDRMIDRLNNTEGDA